MGLLKRINRTVLEVDMGIVFLGILLQVIGFILNRCGGAGRLAEMFLRDTSYLKGCFSMALGSVLAMVCVSNMYRCIDRALDLNEADAQKVMTNGYIFRYFSLAVVIGICALTGILNPLLVILAYFSLKIAVYLQPLSHKLCNLIFHESDPEYSEDLAPEGNEIMKE